MTDPARDILTRGPGRPETTLLATLTDYREAQAMVDRLSDAGFPVQDLSIVWDGLQQVEYVTGRLTVAGAAGRGAVGGAWFGGLIGLLFAAFSTEGFGVVVAYAVVGAVAGAIWAAVAHAMQRGRRDFATVGAMQAKRYEIWCSSERIGEARRTLAEAGVPAADVDAEVDAVR